MKIITIWYLSSTLAIGDGSDDGLSLFCGVYYRRYNSGVKLQSPKMGSWCILVKVQWLHLLDIY